MEKRKTCFVISGFGPKTDHETKHIIDLDKTFEHLIKPVFKQLKIDCFRSDNIKHSGIIDVPMYEWILKADIVVADISTLNANALYELGVRHALRPNTTIVIAESKTRYPFDLNHIIIRSYEHLGAEIDPAEAKRFRKELTSLVKAVLSNIRSDSPVYTFLPNLRPPVFSDEEIGLIKEIPKNQVTLSELVSDAEVAKNKMDFYTSKLLYDACLRFEPQNVFLKQRLALVTYKDAKPNAKQALLDAQKVLKDLNPEDSTDTETLGLSGAINKRLFEETGSEKYLERSLMFYAKGFHIVQDYYNGINYAYVLTLKATTTQNKLEAISFYIQGQQVREQIVEICKGLIKSKGFKDRDDMEWIYQSLAQAYIGLGMKTEMNKVLDMVTKYSKGKFDSDTFKNQNQKLVDFISNFKKKHRI